MKKVLLLTDSLGLPRLEPEPIGGDEVWTYALAAALPEYFFYFHCVGGLTTTDAVDHLRGVLGAYEPDIVIIQLGIVDCYPRALRKKEVAVLSRLPFVGRAVHSFVKSHYASIVRFRDLSYVSLAAFKESHEKLRTHFKSAAVSVLPIAPANTAYAARNPLIERNIELYNAVAASVHGADFFATLFDGMDVDKMYLSDNYHLSKDANGWVVERLRQRLSAIPTC